MKNQKICIIGEGLAGLTTCLALKDQNLDIDLYLSSSKNRKVDKRITAISESNYSFLSKIGKKLNSKLFWPCKNINLYYEKNNELFNFLNFDKDGKNLMYIFENQKLKKELIKLLINKNIKFKNKKIEKVNPVESYVKFNNKKSYYDLIILCLGAKSPLYKDVTNDRSINKDYNEVAITGYINHKSKLINPKQYFLQEGPLAFLPFNKKSFSFVWSLDRNFYLKNKINLKSLVFEKIKKIFSQKKIFKISEIFSYPIQLNLRKNYYKNNVLILGEGLHSVHPIAGQGFNLVLRDINKLSSLIKKNLKLGLTIKNSYLLSEFCADRKFENTLISLGIDLTNTFFKKNKFFDPFKNVVLSNIAKSENIKKFSKIFSDKGISI